MAKTPTRQQPEPNADFVREVDEDLRRDQLKAIWSQYGLYIIGAAALIVLLTAGYRSYTYFQAREAARSGDAFLAALDAATAGRNDEAVEAFLALADDAGSGYRYLARLRRAATLTEMDQRDAAIAAFDDIALDAGAPRHIRDLANIRAAYLALDGEDFAGAADRVEALANENGPWRAQASEVMAFADYAGGRLSSARTRYTRIGSDPEAPASLRRRAGLFISLIDSQSEGDTTEESAPPPDAPTN